MGSHQDYFDDQLRRSVPEFWKRFGSHPNVAGKRVLDFGCGHGAMSLELAREGADVVGIDLNRTLIDWAQQHVATTEVSGSMRFLCEDIGRLPAETYDYIISKDTFEHVQHLDEVLLALRTRLASAGQIWVGFAPLFYSPRGAHGEMGVSIPWAHVPSRRLLYLMASRHRGGAPVHGLSDLGLNGMTPREFRQTVSGAGLRFQSLKYNQGDKRGVAILGRLREFGPLERFATVSIYAILVPQDGPGPAPQR